MAFLRAFFKLKEAKDVLDELELAKINAKRARQGLPPLEPPHLCDCICRPIKACLAEVFPCNCVPGRLPAPKSLWKRMWFQGTKANEVTKRVTGFLCGVFLSVVMLYLLLVQFEVELVPSLTTSFLIATVLPFALAFSPRARCVTALVFPSLFTDKGQALMLSYMLMVVTNGPVENFNYNTQILATSGLCAQDELLRSTKELYDYVTRPLYTLAEKVEEVLVEMERFCERAEKRLEAMAANFEDIIDEMEKIHGWYVKAKKFCNTGYSKIGDSCRAGALDIKATCGVKYSFIKEGLCLLAMSFVEKAGCKGVAAGADKLCNIDLPEINLGIKERINKTIEEKKRQIRAYFWFDIKFFRNSTMEEETNTNYTTILSNIKAELFYKVQFISDVLKITQWTLFIFTSMVFIMAVWYLYKFHNVIHYDNHYITRFVEELDGKRMLMHDNTESIFPLTCREELSYIYTTSMKITKREFLRIIGNIFLLLPIMINLVLTAVCDIGLWWILTLINRIFSADYTEQIPGAFEMVVEGAGSMAGVYDKVIQMSESVSKKFDSSKFWKCVPHPSEPDWEKYATIRNLCIYLLLIAIMQGYILRLRHVICDLFYPNRARERAAYMYNEILQLRGTFTTYLRRQVQRATDERANVEKVSLCHRLGACCPSLRPVLNSLGYAQKYCLGCGLAGSTNDLESFVHCQNYGCSAVYCKACYEDLNNQCTSCMRPVDYGDISDVSEERDSSSDDEELFPTPAKAESVEQKKLQAQGELIALLLKQQVRQRVGGKTSTTSTTTSTTTSETDDSTSDTTEYTNSPEANGNSTTLQPLTA